MPYLAPPAGAATRPAIEGCSERWDCFWYSATMWQLPMHSQLAICTAALARLSGRHIYLHPAQHQYSRQPVLPVSRQPSADCKRKAAERTTLSGHATVHWYTSAQLPLTPCIADNCICKRTSTPTFLQVQNEQTVCFNLNASASSVDCNPPRAYSCQVMTAAAGMYTQQSGPVYNCTTASSATSPALPTLPPLEQQTYTGVFQPNSTGFPASSPAPIQYESLPRLETGQVRLPRCTPSMACITMPGSRASWPYVSCLAAGCRH